MPHFSLVKKIVPILFLVCIFSCQKDFYSVGNNFFESQSFVSGSEIVPVATYQERTTSVQSNGLPLIQLGEIKHPLFGTSEASFVSQLQLSISAPTFGSYRQDIEDEADSDDDIDTIAEEETVTAVFLEIPFFVNQNDSDGDGVIDALDVDPEDPTSDTDGDTISDSAETSAGTNPLDEDSDGDGILDSEDEDNSGYDPENRVYEIDSIYGNRQATFDLKVHRLSFYLNDLDPENNFESAKLYYSDQDFFEAGFFQEVLYDDSYQLNFDELRFNYEEDDPETEDVDETQEIETRLSPRIRVPLDTAFFQENLIDQEGKSTLENQQNFNAFLRGLIIKIDNISDDLYMLLNINSARVVVDYTYRNYTNSGTEDDTSDDIVEDVSRTFTLSLGGIRINTLKNDLFDQSIVSQFEASQSGTPSERIFLNNGRFNARVRLFDDALGGESQILDSLRSQSWLINEANLVFYLDTLQMQSTDALLAERIYLYDHETGVPLDDYSIDTSVDLSDSKKNKSVFGGILEYDDNQRPYYKFRITEHVSQILRRDSTNVDLGLVVTSNINDFTTGNAKTDTEAIINYPQAAILNPIGTVLIGSHPQEGDVFAEQKLQLEIIYTEF